MRFVCAIIAAVKHKHISKYILGTGEAGGSLGKMLLRPDFRRNTNGMEGMEGVKGETGVKMRILGDLKGHLKEGARGINGAGKNEHLIGADLKKSNVNLKEADKPKSNGLWRALKGKKKRNPK
ncbi:hypothetical protein K1719_043086 [Acacia pycnantha]|nr:hypothetical protein K1719_043086 [Acacia pycnantha]